MIGISVRCLFVVSVVLFTVNGATIKDISSEKSSEKSLSDLLPLEQDERPNQSAGTNSYSFLQPLISRGYDNEYDPPVHYATYTTSSGHNPVAIVAIAVFSVFGLLLFLQLLGVSGFRSMPSSWLSLPSDWGLRVEDIPEIMTKVTDWIEKLPGNPDGILKRSVREATDKVALSDWILAYKKDPVEYQYIRKLACQTLGKSELAKGAVETQLGKTLLSTLGRFMEDGTELEETIRDVIGHPEKCAYIAFVEEDDDLESNEENNIN